MNHILIIVHAPPYGSERVLSALRLASALAGQEKQPVTLQIFLMSDATSVALAGQAPATAGGGLGEMIEDLLNRGARIKICRTCALARGLIGQQLIAGIEIGTLPELADATLAADKVITF